MMSKFGTRTKIQERKGKKLILVFCIEFYDFWSKPHLNLIKDVKLQLIKEIQISRQMTKYCQN